MSVLFPILERLHRAHIRFGGSTAESAAGVLPVEHFDWPADLPPLPAEVRAWHEHRGGDSLRQVADQLTTPDPELPLRPTFIPIAHKEFYDVEDGKVWGAVIDESGLEYEFQPVADSMTAYAEQAASNYEQRVAAPSRNLRIEARADVPWTRDAVFDEATLHAAPVGTLLVDKVWMSTRENTVLWIKVGEDGWFRDRVRLVGEELATQIDALLDLSVRWKWRSGESLELVDSASASQSIGRNRRDDRKAALWAGAANLWTRPSLEQLIQRLSSLFRDRYSALVKLNDGAQDSQIKELEQAVGRPLPADLVALYSFANGQSGDPLIEGSGVPLFGGFWLCPIAEAIRASKCMLGLAKDEFGPSYWDPALVALMSDGMGNLLCVDVAGSYGPEGCVVEFDHEQPELRVIRYESIESWLECYVDALERGVYVEHEGELVPREYVQRELYGELTAHEAARTNGVTPWKRTLVLSGVKPRSPQPNMPRHAK